jgi:hypothetical protein
MHFQRQHGLQCGMHAANNAVGQRLLVAADLDHEATELGREMAVRAQEAQRRRSTGAPEELAVLQKRTRKALVGPGGGQWSGDVVIRALARRGYYAHRRAAADLTFDRGDWLLFGDKFHKGNRPYGHAVAVRGSMWLDSEDSSPVMLVDCEMPETFRPWVCFEINKQPPAGVPAEEEVDLAQDD